MPNGGVEALMQMQNDLYGSSSDEDNALVSVFDSVDHLYTPDLSADDELLCPTCCSGPRWWRRSSCLSTFGPDP